MRQAGSYCRPGMPSIGGAQHIGLGTRIDPASQRRVGRQAVDRLARAGADPAPATALVDAGIDALAGRGIQGYALGVQTARRQIAERIYGLGQARSTL